MKPTLRAKSLQLERNKILAKRSNQHFHHLYPQATNNMGLQIKKYSFEIQKAFQKYDKLSKQYKLQSRMKNMDLVEEVEQSEEKAKNKFDPDIAMAKLRHLQNKAEKDKVDQELQKREIRSHRQNRNWKKYSNSVKEPYLTTYRNYLREKLANYEDDSDEEREESKESKKSKKSIEEEPSKIRFAKQLKKHPMILQYTKNKIKEKEEFFSGKKLKAHSLQLQRNLQKSTIEAQFQNFFEAQKKQKKATQIRKEKNEKIVDGKIGQLLNKKNKKKLPQRVLKSQRCQKFLVNQSQVYLSQENDGISRDNKIKLKQRLNQITIELSKAQSKPLSPLRDEVQLKQSIISSVLKTKSLLIDDAKKSKTISHSQIRNNMMRRINLSQIQSASSKLNSSVQL